MGNKEELKIGGTIKSSMDLIVRSAFYLILFELVYKGLIIFIFKPILNLIIGLFISAGGYDLLINGDIYDFFMSISGLLLFIILLLLAVVLVYYEFTVILLILDRTEANEEMKLLEITETALFKLRNVIGHNRIGLGFYILFLIPILNFGIKSSLLPSISIPDFITGELGKYPLGQYLMLVGVLVLVYIFSKLFITLPIMVFSNKNYGEAWRLSYRTISGSGLRVAFLIILSLMVWVFIGELPIFILRDVNFIFLKLLKVLSNIFIFLSSILISPFILTVSYISYRFYLDLGQLNREEEDKHIELGSLGSLVWDSLAVVFKFIEGILFKLNKKSKLIGLIALILLVAFSIYDVEFSEALYEKQYVIGHRGSVEGVENTINTILAAGELGSDYVEMDVLLSKDNIPVVIHDNNLKRLAGQSKKISDLKLDEILEIEIKSGDKKDRIPSLRQLAKESKNNTKLLLEFKTHGYEKASIIDETMKVLEEEGILEDTIFHTAEIDLLQEFNEKYGHRDLKIGYVFIGTIGKLSSRKISQLPMNFISAEESLISKKLLREAHKANLPVLAWTINEDYKAKVLLELGVDGLITDYPREMIEIRDSILVN